jgi:hypothetical protein
VSITKFRPIRFCSRLPCQVHNPVALFGQTMKLTRKETTVEDDKKTFRYAKQYWCSGAPPTTYECGRRHPPQETRMSCTHTPNFTYCYDMLQKSYCRKSFINQSLPRVIKTGRILHKTWLFLLKIMQVLESNNQVLNIATPCW